MVTVTRKCLLWLTIGAVFTESAPHSQVQFTNEKCHPDLEGKKLEVFASDATKYKRCSPVGFYWVLPCTKGTYFSGRQRRCIPPEQLEVTIVNIPPTTPITKKHITPSPPHRMTQTKKSNKSETVFNVTVLPSENKETEQGNDLIPVSLSMVSGEKKDEENNASTIPNTDSSPTVNQEELTTIESFTLGPFTEESSLQGIGETTPVKETGDEKESIEFKPKDPMSLYPSEEMTINDEKQSVRSSVVQSNSGSVSEPTYDQSAIEYLSQILGQTPQKLLSLLGIEVETTPKPQEEFPFGPITLFTECIINETCPFDPSVDETYCLHDSDANRYYQCSPGGNWIEQKCPGNLIFTGQQCIRREDFQSRTKVIQPEEILPTPAVQMPPQYGGRIIDYESNSLSQTLPLALQQLMIKANQQNFNSNAQIKTNPARPMNIVPPMASRPSVNGNIPTNYNYISPVPLNSRTFGQPPHKGQITPTPTYSWQKTLNSPSNNLFTGAHASLPFALPSSPWLKQNIMPNVAISALNRIPQLETLSPNSPYGLFPRGNNVQQIDKVQNQQWQPNLGKVWPWTNSPFSGNVPQWPYANQNKPNNAWGVINQQISQIPWQQNNYGSEMSNGMYTDGYENNWMQQQPFIQINPYGYGNKKSGKDQQKPSNDDIPLYLSPTMYKQPRSVLTVSSMKQVKSKSKDEICWMADQTIKSDPNNKNGYYVCTAILDENSEEEKTPVKGRWIRKFCPPNSEFSKDSVSCET